MEIKPENNHWTEAERSAALAQYGILDTPQEKSFDDIVKLASRLLEAPIAAVNLIDQRRQWFKAEIGLGVREMPLDDSICKFALLQEERMIVTDTLEDPRFNCNPLVRDLPGLRFYAGELLKTPKGLPIGTLCVLDTKPRPDGLNEEQQFALQTLAQQVVSQLELRKLILEQDVLLKEQTRTAAALRMERDRSTQILQGMDEGFVLLDDEFRVQEINAGALKLENRPACDIIGRSHWDVWPGSADLPLAEVYRRSIEDRVPVSLEQHYVFPDGRAYWLDIRGYPVHGGLAIFYRDISERKRAEEALHASRERFQKIVVQAATGVVQTDNEHRIVLANQRFCDMLGYSEAELLGTSIVDITAPDFKLPTTNAVSHAIDTGSSFVIEKQYCRKDGSFLWATSSVSPLRGSAGEHQGIVAIVIDITDRKKTEADLHTLAAHLSEANQRKIEFLATLAHELRNPLAPIRNGLEVLRLAGDNRASAAKVQEMMQRQVNHMVHLINDLLDIARINSGKVELRKAVVELKGIVANAVESSLPAIDAAHHTLDVHIPGESLMVYVDATRITQVLGNLLTNAAKYTPDKGHIELSVRRDEQQAVIAVSDTGIGIPQEAMPMLFEMFSQLPNNAGRAQGGLGIGLSLVHRLVEMHDGTVTATSPGEGKGSTLVIRLPLAQDGKEAQMANLQDVSAAGAGTKPLKVLIADDNADAAESLAAVLQLGGHYTVVAHDGYAALKQVLDSRPEVVFLDIGMPGLTGYEVARMVRKTPGLESTVLVALTGWGAQHDQARAREAGFSHHLTKPADIAAINALLQVLGEGP